MNSQAVQANLILIRRLADGTVEWIPIQTPPQHMPAAPDSAYTVVDRAGYEAPQTLVPERRGEDLVIKEAIEHHCVVLSHYKHRQWRRALFRLGAYRGLAGARDFRGGRAAGVVRRP